MNEMDEDSGNKTQRLYRCGSNYALSKTQLGQQTRGSMKKREARFF